jgi:hypothetical protein
MMGDGDRGRWITFVARGQPICSDGRRSGGNDLGHSYRQYEISCASSCESCPGVIEVNRENLERETGIEPATNGLGSRYSTIELLPLC